jgi:hypothetical protein
MPKLCWTEIDEAVIALRPLRAGTEVECLLFSTASDLPDSDAPPIVPDWLVCDNPPYRFY